ncbi:hypothetical protein [Pseudomonas sp. S9]|uniref:hypothetical protein n=1 Tax=Pseudomonas sp. S9 TaxID=686578 RepID=UPI0002556DE9|nr:hypothetical protein [Pseudomonas sp. S9]
MNKPHIKKLSKGSPIYQCVSREMDEAYPFMNMSGYGLSPSEAFTSWKKSTAFLRGQAWGGVTINYE